MHVVFVLSSIDNHLLFHNLWLVLGMGSICVGLFYFVLRGVVLLGLPRTALHFSEWLNHWLWLRLHLLFLEAFKGRDIIHVDVLVLEALCLRSGSIIFRLLLKLFRFGRLFFCTMPIMLV